jgi:tight adherence protein B
MSAARVRRAVVEIEIDAVEIDAPEWRVLALVWRLAEQSGAPLASTLDRFGEAMRALGRVAERREVLLAGPRSTIRLVALLPPAALLLAALLGFNPLHAFANPVGIATAAAGATLLLLGVRWASGLARRVSEADWVAGWEFELLAIGVGGGSPPQRALKQVADCVDGARVGWVRLESLGWDGPVVRVVAQAEALGTPLGPALLSEAENSRLRAQAELERAAERLGVRVLVPLGVCVLPAFVLLGVVPVLMAVVGGAMP